MIRTRLTIAPDFVYPSIVEPQIRTRLNSQFLRVSQLRPRSQTGDLSALGLRNAQITTSVNERTVTLRGQVASERDRVVAERMAKMEPGVDSVVNELVVVQ